MRGMARTEPEPGEALEELHERVAELERERELLNAIANTAPGLLCVVDAEGRVRPYATNKAFEATLGYEPAETGGVLFWERYVPPEDVAGARALIEEAVGAGRVVQRDGRWVARDGRIVHVTWSCHPLPMIASGPIFLVAAADITDRKLHEDEVRRSRMRIVAAADEARRRIERDLHDGAQQRLIALLLSLRIARSKQAEGSDARTRLDTAIGELSAALEELRELARGIHPAVLTERGLAVALAGLAERAPFPVVLDVPARRFDPMWRRRSTTSCPRRWRTSPGTHGPRAPP